jgi:hypothetical protein
MLKKVAFWSVVLFPAVIACAFVLLIVAAVYIIHISRDAEAYTRAVVPLQQLARHVYSRQLALWQSQMHCTVFDEVLFYKPRPGRCEFNNIEFSTVLTFDSKGFRQTSPPMRRDSDRPNRGRIIVLGDSHAMGWGVQDEETFASVLAAEHGFEVFNLAVSSYGTARELLRLRKEFDVQKGDIVVIQYHPNDLEENLAFLKSGGLPHHVPSDLGLLAHTPQGYQVPQVSKSIAWAIWGKFTQVVGKLTQTVGKLTETVTSAPDGKSAAEIFLSVIDHFQELAQARVVVCEVPGSGLATSFTEDLKRLAEGRMIVIKPVWETSDFYRLDEHLNSIGHRKLARIIASAILSD